MPAERIDLHRVRFSHGDVRFQFRDGRTIGDLVNALDANRVNLETFPPIRLVRRGGNLFSLDNRRLEAFRRANVWIPFRMATALEASAEDWKFTTGNDGITVRVKGEPKP